uniref:NR LBD domain-containing protein n=1 Tax=Caenorhabditis tropicalis TaxID=1561998 RepID=A0A1I7UL66_9PELO
MSSIKKFIRSVPQLMSVVPNMDTELDGFIQRIMTGLLEIRAAFTFDPISFISFDDTKFFSVVTMLRTGLRNTVFTDNEIALLSGIYILQTANGVESNVSLYTYKNQHSHMTQLICYGIIYCLNYITE